ncbi:MAG TPA: PEP-CTERM sorting domain-containing protein [Verrucomicrobiae bacterium]|nr:PEP-CTERM sorting domain-containing protein [Verrucomicrobiae bacterium]
MRTGFRWFVISLVTLFFTASAHGQNPSLSDFSFAETIDMSGLDMMGMTTDETNLFVLNNVLGQPDQLLVCGTDGVVRKSFSSPSMITTGLAFSNGRLVLAAGQSGNDGLYGLDVASGSLQGPFSTPVSSPFGGVLSMGKTDDRVLVLATPNGFDGGQDKVLFVWSTYDPASLQSNGTFRLTLPTINGDVGIPESVEMYNGKLYVAMDFAGDESDQLYQVDTNGNVLDDLALPQSGDVSGFAFVGSSLFVAERSTESILRYDAIPEPASWSLVMLGAAIAFGLRRRSSQ